MSFSDATQTSATPERAPFPSAWGRRQGVRVPSANYANREGKSSPYPSINRLSSGTTYISDPSNGGAAYVDTHPITYRVLPPGGGTSDPRLGVAQKRKEDHYLQGGLGNPDDDNPADFDTEDEPPSQTVPLVVITRRFSINASANAEQFPHRDIVDKPVGYFESMRKNINLNVLYEPNYLRKTDCTCAEEAVQFYNQTHVTQYQIVETLGSYNIWYWGLWWFHCNFRAVEVELGCGRPSCPKLFFAELYLNDNVMYANDCMMLDNPNLHIVRGCQMCGDQLSHPANSFQVGK